MDGCVVWMCIFHQHRHVLIWFGNEENQNYFEKKIINIESLIIIYVPRQ